MTLFERIKADQLTARKAKDGLKATLLTTLIGELTAIGKNDGNRAVTDADVVKLVKKFLDGVNETIKLLGDTNLQATVTAGYEKAILTDYMPQQMDEQVLTIAVRMILNELGVGANMGQVMSALKSKHAGKYDGAMASKIVKACI